ncbi:MAG: hypothetical protein DME97_12885 [Verrucomicrobia bacterium]|nr:MAG: hypothetical protein DME97_12885 [Verrucomicrobiota bacterium]
MTNKSPAWRIAFFARPFRQDAHQGTRLMIETAPLEQAADGYARMMHGKARFRIVPVAKEEEDRAFYFPTAVLFIVYPKQEN